MIDTPDIVGMQSDYLQALTTERSARTTLDLATRTRERAVRLAEAEAIPKRDLQQAQADESRAADDLQRAQSAIAAARGRLRSAGMSEDEINRLAATSHSVNRIVALIAPITGTITDRKAGLGQVVQAGSGDPLFMIADLSSVWVNADVYEDQLAHIHAGAQVKIRTPAYPNETFDARVDQIGSTVDSDKHTIAVRCVVTNSRGQLKPGMFAAVVLRAAAIETATTVPSSAVVVEGDRRSVFVEESPGKYVKRLVETGSEVDGSVVIRSGLREGERVVVRGGLLMSAGPSQ
jgi:cobalt-zinc-cadmium efflux system membrane fusion protein